MANITVTLYSRIKTEDGEKPFCKPVYLPKGRLKPLYALSMDNLSIGPMEFTTCTWYGEMANNKLSHWGTTTTWL